MEIDSVHCKWENKKEQQKKKTSAPAYKKKKIERWRERKVIEQNWLCKWNGLKLKFISQNQQKKNK